MKGIYILLGSNLGDRKNNLRIAKKLIKAESIDILNESSVYETAAWGKTDQQAFLNQVLKVETKIAAAELLAKLLAIEKQMGRIRKEKWGERLIDIDILYYDELILETSDLQIPHQQIQERRFTLVPLVEIASDFIHPVLQKTQKQLLIDCQDPLSAQKVEK